MTTPNRILAALGIAALFAIAPASARAQANAPAPAEATEESDDSLYGYIGTGLFSAMAIFAICKSARR